MTDVTEPFVAERLGGVFLDDLVGTVVGERIEDDNFVGPLDALQAAFNVANFVSANDAGGYPLSGCARRSHWNHLSVDGLVRTLGLALHLDARLLETERIPFVAEGGEREVLRLVVF